MSRPRLKVICKSILVRNSNRCNVCVKKYPLFLHFGINRHIAVNVSKHKGCNITFLLRSGKVAKLIGCFAQVRLLMLQGSRWSFVAKEVVWKLGLRKC